MIANQEHEAVSSVTSVTGVPRVSVTCAAVMRLHGFTTLATVWRGDVVSPHAAKGAQMAIATSIVQALRRPSVGATRKQYAGGHPISGGDCRPGEHLPITPEWQGLGSSTPANLVHGHHSPRFPLRSR